MSKLYIDGERHRITPEYAWLDGVNGIQIRLRGTFEDEA
jgi:hypothetical protein